MIQFKAKRLSFIGLMVLVLLIMGQVSLGTTASPTISGDAEFGREADLNGDTTAEILFSNMAIFDETANKEGIFPLYMKLGNYIGESKKRVIIRFGVRAHMTASSYWFGDYSYWDTGSDRLQNLFSMSSAYTEFDSNGVTITNGWSAGVTAGIKSETSKGDISVSGSFSFSRSVSSSADSFRVKDVSGTINDGSYDYYKFGEIDVMRDVRKHDLTFELMTNLMMDADDATYLDNGYYSGFYHHELDYVEFMVRISYYENDGGLFNKYNWQLHDVGYYVLGDGKLSPGTTGGEELNSPGIGLVNGCYEGILYLDTCP